MSWGGNAVNPNAGQQPGGQPHPTVPYGQDGGNAGGFQPVPQNGPTQQGGFPLAPQQPMGQYGQPQQPNSQAPAQHPTVPQGQAPVQPQPQGQQPTQGNRVNLGRDTILDGPDVPVELRGRSLGQAMSIYSALANDWLQRQNGGFPTQQGQQPARSAQPQGQQPPQQVAGQRPQQPSQQFGGQQQQTGGWDWSNPEDAIGRVVEERVGNMLRPVIAQTQGNAVSQARSVAAQQIRDFQQLEAGIMQKVAGFSPDALTDPTVWINAARLVRGEMVERGEYNPQANQGGGQIPQVAQYGNPQPGNDGGFNRHSVPAQPYTYFTENPTPPTVHEFGSGSLSPQQREVAAQMGMTPEQYLHWSGGIQR